MLHYEDFQKTVMELNERDFEQWKHLLPAVPLAHRYRYLKAIEKGFSLPKSFDYVMSSLSIKDDEFSSFLQQALISKVRYDSSNPCVFADALLISAD